MPRRHPRHPLPRRLLVAALAVLLTLPLATPAAVAAPAAGATGAADPAAGEAAPGIDRVSASDDTITLHGALPEGDDPATTTIDIYELDPTAAAGGYAATQPVAALAAPQASADFTASVSRLDGARDRGYDKFLAVARTPVGTEPLGTPHYVDDDQFAATNDYPYPQVADKKGLQVEMTDDAENLGVRHAAINVTFDSMMQLTDAGPAATITYQVDGRPFYFSRSYVEQLDGQIKSVSDNGAIVNLICILYANGGANSAFRELVHPDAQVGKGTVYAFNTKTAEGLEYFKAAMEFLTDRYTRTDQRYGRALGYIIGNEVDSAGVWANMGDQSLGDFTEYYLRALRVAWQAARKAYTSPHVYVSLDHEWTVAYDPSQPAQYYPGKQVVDTLTALSHSEGDFPWDIAYHPYPQDLTNPAFWNDTQATTDPDTTPLITFKNIEVLPQYLQRPENEYRGAPRRIILSEQGCNTTSDTEAAQEMQAACYAYAYYKVRFLDGIDAFILHRHVDHQGEGGLRLGLWSWDPDRPESAMPGTQKYIYHVFQEIDTDKSLQVTAFALPIIGITSWSQVIPNFDPAALDQRADPQPVGVQVGGSPLLQRSLAGFDDGTDGWQTSDNTNAVERTTDSPDAGSGALRVHFDSGLPAESTDAKTDKAANVFLAHPVDASLTPHLTLAVRLPQPAAGAFKPGNTFHADVTVYAADGSTARGTARLDPADGWTRLAVDLSRWDGRRAVTRVKVAVRATSDDTWRGTFDLDSVGLSAGVIPAVTRANLDLTATTVHTPGPGAGVTLTLTDSDAVPLVGRVRLDACDGVTLDPSGFTVTGTAAAGGTRTLTATITGYQPADPAHPRLCLTYLGHTVDTVVTLLPPTTTVLYGFEDGTEGWTAGPNVTAVTTVTGFANGPGTPYDGTHALDATAALVDASAPKTVTVTPSTPLRLPVGASLVAWIDAYGGAPGATGYQATITVYSGDEQLSAQTAISTDRWNQISADLSAWPYRDDITRVDISFRAVGTTTAWPPHFQVDDVGYTS